MQAQDQPKDSVAVGIVLVLDNDDSPFALEPFVGRPASKLGL
jgi:hypothetical protein